MMTSRRYIFIDYEDLIKINFKKLEKICDRIFVFVHSDISSVPIHLVQQMQKMGKDIRWISVEDIHHETSLHISFLMGKLHGKVSTDIEFAIFSNEESFDPLVNFINHSGRNCLRVKQKMSDIKQEEEEEDKDIEIELIDDQEEEENTLDHNLHHYDDLDDLENHEDHDFSEHDDDDLDNAQNDYQINIPFEAFRDKDSKTAVISKPKKVKKAKLQAIEKIAEETIRRLIRSGNRPAEISMLKSYILLQHRDHNSPDTVELVIDYMKETKDIRFENEEVVYNF